jgi:opacity protein-like surface antigen
MKTNFLLAALPLGLAACTTTPQPLPGVVRNVTVLVGERYLDDSDADPVDEPPVIGLEFDSYERGAVVGYELGVQHAQDEQKSGGIEDDVEMTEFYFGARKTWELGSGRLRPYLGAGAALVHGRFKQEGSDSESDTVFCPYVRGGVYYAFEAGINVGLEYRRDFFGEFDSGDRDVDVDYSQIAGTIGWSF